ncbi:hypothetical protein VNO78_14257 [Psophocarpus tetragonolobus]|uniref:Scarecrow-like protein 14 n=1 Tax=Psophocarpus tetragonolobus TaxID=3891 RepID=A0AAN9SSU1_PSOTE
MTMMAAIITPNDCCTLIISPFSTKTVKATGLKLPTTQAGIALMERSDEESWLEENDSSAVLSYIKQMLMEEEEEKYSMFDDSIAIQLQDTERSFYEVMSCKSYPPSVESPEQSLSGSSGDFSITSSCGSNSTMSSAESPFPLDPDPSTLPIPSNLGFGFLDNPLAEIFETAIPQPSLLSSFTKAPCPLVIKTETSVEGDADGRSSTSYMDETELSDLFDKVLLGTGLGKGTPPKTTLHQTHMLSCGDVLESEEEVVDLRTLLMLCAQAVASDTPSFATQLVNQIKQHSSPMGNETQRLAHYFGNALEARLDGTGYQVYCALSSKRISAKDMIKAYHVYASICPFEKLAIVFTNNSIKPLTRVAQTVHIIDFGVRYGFKWPKLISSLSTRPGGPPKLRITGIDLPQQSGFRPEERVLETGRRLENYCKRFNVPFEFNAIVQRWDTIRVEDLKIEKNEFVAVNCMFQFEHLLDETVVLDNPRDAVLRLIRKANPDIFIHSIVNGSYDVPFFVSRFREAVFHYSALFDMLESNVSREDPMRLMFEKDLFGKEIMNIIACEGCQRVERPQTYKQWQLRNMRCGFKQLPVDHKIDRLRGWLRDDAYNTNFMLEVDGHWVLQGWKGRILRASSCWVPA